jgi:hypothetical protein
MDKAPKTPGERLAQARKKAGFTSARKAASAYGWAYPTYASHESGWRNIPRWAADKYAEAFGVKAGWLLGYNETKQASGVYTIAGGTTTINADGSITTTGTVTVSGRAA